MIELNDLTVGYRKKRVLEHCSAEILPGQITALLGLNGAGKTTLIRTLLGFIQPESGTISVDGKPMPASARERAKLLSYVPQRSLDNFSYTCREFVAMGASSSVGTFSSPSSKVMKKAEEILEKLGCGHLADQPLDQISGGENRIAYLARAVLQDAKYMIMDEPVGSLDLTKQHVFLKQLRSYIDHSCNGCLLSIHDPALILPFADRFLFIKDGKIVRDVSKADADFKEKFDDALHLLYGDELMITHLDGGGISLTVR